MARRGVRPDFAFLTGLRGAKNRSGLRCSPCRICCLRAGTTTCPQTARLRKLRPRFFLRLAVPEKPFGLTLVLRFFDHCGKRALPASATGSGRALSHRQREAAIPPVFRPLRKSACPVSATGGGQALFPPKGLPVLKRPRGACGPPRWIPRGVRGDGGDEGTAETEGPGGQPLRPRCARPPPLAQGRLAPGNARRYGDERRGTRTGDGAFVNGPYGGDGWTEGPHPSA